MTTAHQSQALNAITAHPGSTAAELVGHCTLFRDSTALASVLANLRKAGEISRACTTGPVWRYWPGDTAPQSTHAPRITQRRQHVPKGRDLTARLLARARREPLPPPEPPRPAAITPDWCVYAVDTGLLAVHKDSGRRMRLDAELVVAIRGMALPATHTEARA